MDLTATITSAENQFKQILENYFISIFGEIQLPSHGLGHHRRVWNNAKELILVLAKDGLINDPKLISSLIIASFLHDLGMAKDHGPRHGVLSNEFCVRFLAENNLDQTDFPGLLQAVLEHDQKDYTSPSVINLHTLLSVADDLDAFGYAGIYRYIEIYRLRGVNHYELGPMIRENARRRYLHFEKLFSSQRSIVEKHRLRYEVLDVFFMNYEEQLRTTAKGEFMVVEILTDMISLHKDLFTTISNHQSDKNPFVVHFFTELKHNLS